MRDATVEERLAALRRVREANQEEAEPTPEGTRRRLTTRLRDRFRIRTRAHGVEPEAETPPASEAESVPTMPAAPAAAHTSS